MTTERHFRRPTTRILAGYLVYAGEALGTTDDGTEIVEDRDVVIDSVLRDPTGWLVAYHQIRVRDDRAPAA